MHPDLFEMVKFCKENNIRTVVFTSGIKKSSDIPLEMKNHLENECNEYLEKIDELEPWNERAKQNIIKTYNRFLIPGTFTSITRFTKKI